MCPHWDCTYINSGSVTVGKAGVFHRLCRYCARIPRIDGNRSPHLATCDANPLQGTTRTYGSIAGRADSEDEFQTLTDLVLQALTAPVVRLCEAHRAESG